MVVVVGIIENGRMVETADFIVWTCHVVMMAFVGIVRRWWIHHGGVVVHGMVSVLDSGGIWHWFVLWMMLIVTVVPIVVFIVRWMLLMMMCVTTVVVGW